MLKEKEMSEEEKPVNKVYERPELLPLWEVSGDRIKGLPDDAVLTYPTMGEYLLGVIENYRKEDPDATIESVFNRICFSMAASLNLLGPVHYVSQSEQSTEE